MNEINEMNEIEAPAVSQLLIRDTLFIGGRWVRSRSDRTILVIDANTEKTMGSVPCGTAEDVAAAVAAARAALEGWSQTPVAHRSEYLGRIVGVLKSRSEELAGIIAREVGMPLPATRRMQVELPIAQWTSYVRLGAEMNFEETLGHTLITREPVGVVGAITPWNYPLRMMASKVAPALLAGCTVVLKPSEVAPLSAFILAEAIAEAGLPAGVFNLIVGDGPVTGEALVAHPEVDCITFTGSTAVGRRICAAAAPTLKRVLLELGGKSASIILEGADLRAAITATLESCFMNSGQTCVAQTRLLVQRKRFKEAAQVVKEIAESFSVGNSLDESVKLGPLVSREQQTRVRGLIATGIAEGAQLITGGAEPPVGLERGFFVRPTVFAVEDPASTIAQEEIFGPVLALIPFDDEADAIRIANDTPYGLSGAVWAGTDEAAERTARRLRTGQVSLNGGPSNMDAPFGGFKQSGLGREGGRFGLDEFLEYKSMNLPVRR